jgi:hypothetical protein
LTLPQRSRRNRKRSKLRVPKLSNPLPRPRRRPCSQHRPPRLRHRFHHPTLAPMQAQTTLNFCLTNPSRLPRSMQRMPSLRQHHWLRSLPRPRRTPLITTRIPCSPNLFNRCLPRMSALQIRNRRRTHTLAAPQTMGLTRLVRWTMPTNSRRWSSSSSINSSINSTSSSNFIRNSNINSNRNSRQRSKNRRWRYRQLRQITRPLQSRQRILRPCPTSLLRLLLRARRLLLL